MTITETPQATSGAEALDVRHIAVEAIDPDPNNRSYTLDKAFVASIEAEGVINPVTVITNPADPARFQMVAGHRRLAASEKVGHATIPAVVRDDLDALGVVMLQLVENMAREDLSPTQEAAQLLRAIGVGHTVKSLAAAVGRSQKWVKERLTIAELPAAGRKRIDQGAWTIADGVQAAKIADRPELFGRLIEATDQQPWRNVGQIVVAFIAEAAFEAKAIKLIEQAKAKGVQVLDADTPGIHRLDVLGIDEAEHQGEECHAVILQGRPPSAPRLVGVCTNKANHNKRGPSPVKLPAKDAGATPEQRDAKAAERAARAIERDAKAARADALASIATGKLARAEHVTLIETTLLRTVSADHAKKALRLLGVEYDKKLYEPTVLAEWAETKPSNLAHAARAIALIEHDHHATNQWQQDQSKVRRAWQRFIAANSAWKPSKWDKDRLK